MLQVTDFDGSAKLSSIVLANFNNTQSMIRTDMKVISVMIYLIKMNTFVKIRNII